MGDDELHEFAGKYLHETDDAYFIFDGDKEICLPISQTEMNHTKDTFFIPEWLAIDKGLI